MMITVSYGGLDQEMIYRPDGAVHEILGNARKLFATSITGLGLFTENGVQLPDQHRASDHVYPGQLLILRPAVMH